MTLGLVNNGTLSKDRDFPLFSSKTRPGQQEHCYLPSTDMELMAALLRLASLQREPYSGSQVHRARKDETRRLSFCYAAVVG